MSAIETQTPDLDAIERDAQARVGALEDQRGRLAPEALVSAQGKSELADLESELAEAQRALELVALARSEGTRREVEAARAAEIAERDGHMRRARELQPKIDKATATFDRKLGEAMVALRSFTDLLAEQSQALGAAGERPRHLPPWAGNAAVMYAMQQASVPRGLIVVEGVRAKPVPLSEGSPSQPLGEDLTLILEIDSGFTFYTSTAV